MTNDPWDEWCRTNSLPDAPTWRELFNAGFKYGMEAQKKRDVEIAKQTWDWKYGHGKYNCAAAIAAAIERS